jgi:hypothetical protein
MVKAFSAISNSDHMPMEYMPTVVMKLRQLRRGRLAVLRAASGKGIHQFTSSPEVAGKFF